MERLFTVEDKIGEIVTKFPAAADIFKKYQVDFCCGGDRKLAVAIAEGKIDQQQLINELNDSYQQSNKVKNTTDIDWRHASFSKLIDYIVNKHHAYLQENLPRISELTTTILRVHGANHNELKKVHRLFHNLKLELEQHLIKEEETLFPVIKKYEENPSAERLENTLQIIDELEEEHEGAGDILKELRAITKDYSVPADVCNSYKLTYQLLAELENDMFQHIHLENNILFPRIEREKESTLT